MSIDLVVQTPITSAGSVVEDQGGNPSALILATEQVSVKGKDVVGSSLPVYATGKTTAQEFDNGKTWGRIVRLQDSGTSNSFYDIGIDKGGNLFINSSASSQSNHVLTIAPSGEITLNAAGGLKFAGLQQLSGPGVVDLVIDTSTGQIGHQ